MASDLAAPPAQLPPPDMDVSTAEATTNGDAHHYNQQATASLPVDAAVEASSELTGHSTSVGVDAKVATPLTADPNPAGPTPIEDVASGIQPVADFIPKDSTHLSHPTPPPDEPMTTGATDGDVAMGNTESAAPPPAAEPPIARPEQSLVRPREDDVDDEPSAKRSRVDGEMESPFAESAPAEMDGMAAAPSAETTEAVTANLMETVDEPAKVEATEVAAADLGSVPIVDPSAAAQLPTGDAPVADAEQPQPEVRPAAPAEDASAQATETPSEAKPVLPTATTDGQASAPAPAAAANKPQYSTTPMTSIQKSFLVDKMKNLKKTKNSGPFVRPVDPDALGIPQYRDIITRPMDLSTMEKKLKSGEHTSVQDFVDDFELIIENCLKFNGPNHVISQQALNMQAYFNRMMETIPSSDVVAPPKQERQRSPISRESLPRRESRAPAAPAPAPAPAPAQPVETYALQADGTPQIRRQSTNRPARAIKPPNRDIPYAKPKRKAHQLELRFCEYVLDHIRGHKHSDLNGPFLVPVDPVALNIPHYRQIVKNPMDLGTMHSKLKNGEYGTAKEFKADFDLVINNCTSFNPPGNPVRNMAIALQRQFQTYWNEKERWEKRNKPASNRASSASADEESAEEEEEDEEEDADSKAATIRALQKQLADMQNALMAFESKPGKKKSKTGKSGAPKKIGSVPSASKVKAPAKPPAKKKTRLVTYEEKQEISDAVGKMDEDQIGGLTSIITKNCAKYRNLEDMELEIDDLPNDVQVMLLDYVRKIFGNPKKKAAARDYSPEDAAALDDDDFEPDRRGSGAGGAQKRKKHKPMGKHEQQAAIDDIKNQLKQFDSSAVSESPTGSSFNVARQEPETSGDEESEESEED